jgi:hypothetical protein
LLPIGFDANAGEPIEAIRALREQGPLRFDTSATGFYDRLFSDTLFYRDYISALEVISAPGWLEGLMERLAPDLEKVQRVVLEEFPNAAIDTNVFRHDRTVIRQTLHPADVALAYLNADRHGSLLVANLQALPIRVKAVVSGDQADTRSWLTGDRAARARRIDPLSQHRAAAGDRAGREDEAGDHRHGRSGGAPRAGEALERELSAVSPA